jgi:hypothetical protein
MPRLPIDYSKTIFYRIVCNDLNIKDCYIGHTTNFINRKRYHKNICNNELRFNFKVYKFIRENGGWDNWSMIMIEQINCENFNEACKLERKFIEEYNATLNNNIPSRTVKEYYKNYYNENKDEINEKIKIYYENNKDKVKEQKKKYDEKNKDKKKENAREKITCECGIILCRDSLSKHKKRFIH